MTFGQAFLVFWKNLFISLPVVLPRLAVAWLGTFVVLTLGFKWLKAHIRPHLLRLDDQIRYWAVGLRYKERGVKESERHARTWFFRFWTNFASAPSLCTLSVLLPVLVYWRDGSSTSLDAVRLFFLPGLTFCFSMLMSFVTKRIFKRVRPVREHGSFGHKMKDGSFPSGHSLTSFCFWIMLAVAAEAFGTGMALSLLLFAVGLTITSLTGLSRVYLGVHFPSDVFGGYTIAIIWCLVCYFVLLPVL